MSGSKKSQKLGSYDDYLITNSYVFTNPNYQNSLNSQKDQAAKQKDKAASSLTNHLPRRISFLGERVKNNLYKKRQFEQNLQNSKSKGKRLAAGNAKETQDLKRGLKCQDEYKHSKSKQRNKQGKCKVMNKKTSLNDLKHKNSGRHSADHSSKKYICKQSDADMRNQFQYLRDQNIRQSNELKRQQNELKRQQNELKRIDHELSTKLQYEDKCLRLETVIVRIKEIMNKYVQRYQMKCWENQMLKKQNKELKKENSALQKGKEIKDLYYCIYPF